MREKIKNFIKNSYVLKDVYGAIRKGKGLSTSDIRFFEETPNSDFRYCKTKIWILKDMDINGLHLDDINEYALRDDSKKTDTPLRKEIDNMIKNFKKLEKNLSPEELYPNKELSESRLPSDPNVDPQFGIPSQKKYPLFDEKHVRSAIKLFGHVDAEYEQQLARAIMAKMRKYGISYDEVGPDNKLYKWIPEAYKTKK